MLWCDHSLLPQASTQRNVSMGVLAFCEMEVFRTSWPTPSSYECAQVYLLWIPSRSAYVVFSRGTSFKNDHVKTWQTNNNCHLESPRLWYGRISSFNLTHIWSRGLISKPKWLTINPNPAPPPKKKKNKKQKKNGPLWNILNRSKDQLPPSSACEPWRGWPPEEQEPTRQR